MTETPTPTSRELGPRPAPPRRTVANLARLGLEPGEVPSAVDAVGRPTEATRPVSRVAASHWDTSLWTRG